MHSRSLPSLCYFQHQAVTVASAALAHSVSTRSDSASDPALISERSARRCAPH